MPGSCWNECGRVGVPCCRGTGAKGLRAVSYAKEFGLHPVDNGETLVNFKHERNIRSNIRV